MPMYEFRCRKCEQVFEELLTAAEADAGELKCPNCGGKSVEREFSAFATGTGKTPGVGGGAGGCGPGGFT